MYFPILWPIHSLEASLHLQIEPWLRHGRLLLAVSLTQRRNNPWNKIVGHPSMSLLDDHPSMYPKNIQTKTYPTVSTLKIPSRRASVSKDVKNVSSKVKTSLGCRSDAQAEKPEISAKRTLASGKRSAIGSPAFPLVSRIAVSVSFWSCIMKFFRRSLGAASKCP